MAPQARDYMLRVRMTRDEQAMLDALAETTGLTASDVVRQLVRREYETAKPSARRRPRRTK